MKDNSIKIVKIFESVTLVKARASFDHSPSIHPLNHQVELANKATDILKENGIAYLAMEERTGKTLTSLLIVENCKKVDYVLIITKKKALPGWVQSLQQYPNKQVVFVISSYESVHKLTEVRNFNPKLVIMDESHHAIAGYPKPSSTFKAVRSITYNLPILFLSATPTPNSYSQIYHQFGITKYSPFNKFRNFYDFFKVYGIKEFQYIGARQITKYDKTTEVLKQVLAPYFITYTREQSGFKVEPCDEIVYYDLTKEEIDTMKRFTQIASSASRQMSGLHQLSGGTLLPSNDEPPLTLPQVTPSKLLKLLTICSDSPSNVIFYQYKLEKDLLQSYYNKALLLQGDAFAEGVDLSEYDNVFVYSMSFLVSKYIQRRCRQCNIKRDKEIVIRYLIANPKTTPKKLNIDAMVHDCVSSKRNFTQSYYLKAQM